LPPVTTRSKTDAKFSRPVQVAEAIKDWVVEQGLQAGDRLPGEAELIDRFGMSKGTIREAMRILEAQGLIKTRTGPGGGSFVHEVSRQRAKALLGNYFYFKDLTIGDIYQLRLILEPELAAALAGTLSNHVLEELDANIAEYSTPASDLEEERSQHVASLRFHAILAEHARNPMLGFMAAGAGPSKGAGEGAARGRRRQRPRDHEGPYENRLEAHAPTGSRDGEPVYFGVASLFHTPRWRFVLKSYRQHPLNEGACFVNKIGVAIEPFPA